MLRLFATAVVLSLIAGACSNGDGSAAPDPATTETPNTTATTVVAGVGGCDGQDADSGETSETLTSGGVERDFFLVIPAGYDSSTPAPLILNLHGFNSNAQQQGAYSRLPLEADRTGAVIVTPEGLDEPQRWDLLPDGDVLFMADLVADLSDRLCIDADRVYSVGISNGSGLTGVAACRASDLLAAVAMVAAAIPPTTCGTTEQMPVIFFHGTEDPTVPYGGGVVSGGGTADGLTIGAVEATVAVWAEHNDCASSPTIERMPPDVRITRYEDCAADVVLYTTIGGGHVWPGAISSPALEARLGPNTETIDATDLILEFFERN